MEGTISTKDLKAKLDRKEGIKVVETLAPERGKPAGDIGRGARTQVERSDLAAANHR
jgi:hypothetical protein